MTTHTTTARPGRKGSDMDFSNVPAGCLEEGTETEFGIIEHVSLTAYLIAGRWLSFSTVHGKPQRAEALAIPQGWVDALSDEQASAMRAQSDANVRSLLNQKGVTT
jgi:hypothetical protein